MLERSPHDTLLQSISHIANTCLFPVKHLPVKAKYIAGYLQAMFKLSEQLIFSSHVSYFT